MEPAELNKLIDDYIMGRLDERSKADFENQMQENAQIREAVALRKTMIGQLKVIGDLEMKERILKIQNRIENPTVSKKSNRRILPILAVAAALLLLIVAYFVLKPDPQPNYYANYYEAKDLPFDTRDEVENTQIFEAGKAYQNGNYQLALPLLRAIEEDVNIKDDRITLALAITHLELAQVEEAQNILERYINDENFLYQDQAMWYLALTYLKLKQEDKSIELLKRISDNEESVNQNEAKEILEKLN